MIWPEERRSKASLAMRLYWLENPAAEDHARQIRLRNTRVLKPQKLDRASIAYIENKHTLAPQGLRRCRKCLVIRPVQKFWAASKKLGSGRIWTCCYCAAPLQKGTRKKYKSNEASRNRSRKWRAGHQDLARQRVKSSHMRHPELRTEAARRRRARKARNGLFRVTSEDLRKLRQNQDGLCYLCLQSLPDISAELDHIIPVSRGGRHSIGNLGWTHHKCNRAKGVLLLAEFKHGRNPNRHSTQEQQIS